MLYIVPTPIGNLEDITLRAIRLFEEADIVLCEDTRVTKRLFFLLRERQLLSSQNEPRFMALHSHNEAQVLERFEANFFDACVLYVSDAGMPGFSDPGAKLIAYARRLKIPYTVLPGANAAVTAFVARASEEQQMLFVGFLPHKAAARTKALQMALHSGYATVLYESPHRLKKLLQEIVSLDARRQLFLCKELSKKYERFYEGAADELIEEFGDDIKGEWVVIISPKVSEQLHFSYEDILALSLPKKEKAKLLSQISQESVKSIYTSLMQNE